VVFAIGVPAVTKLSRDDSQPETLPVSPVKLMVAPFEPEGTVADELSVPPTLAGVTEITTNNELAEGQDPFFTTAL
jgi:hypothetical protein